MRTNDAEASCCSAHAVRVARSLAHGMGLPHFTLDLRDEFRAGVVDAVARRARRRADAEPVRALQRPRAPRRDARLRRPPRRRRAGHGPLRAPQRRRPAALGGRPGQGPGLHAVRAAPGDARAPALPARRADQAGGARARRRGRAARRRPRPTRRTSASWPAPAAPRSSPATAARASARGRSSTAAAGCSAATAATTASRSASARGSASRRPSRSTCSPPTRAPTRVTVGPRAALLTHAVQVRDARLHRPGGRGRRGQAALPLAPAAVHGRRHGPGGSTLHLAEPVDGAAPGQTACLLRRRRGRGLRDDRVAEPSIDWSRDLRRDPRALPGLLRAARPPAPAVRVARARRSTTRPCCSPPRACIRSSRTSSATRRRRTTA